MKPEGHELPLPRSGHMCDIYENYMVMFGGMYEITKELNDLLLYDFKLNKWIILFDESVSPKKLPKEFSIVDDNSPNDRSPKKSNSPLGKPNFNRNKSIPKTSSMHVNKRVGSPVKKNLTITMAN
mmetsp:Transcript_930/g.947  ORF Transcript_930/g.947 Transcript_930/m.947 type:complete len:125 (+) Transcript_930:840-1214(+)